MSAQNMVLRTIYLSPTLDDRLRVLAFDNRTTKGDLIRKFLEMGMKLEYGASALGTPAAAKTSSGKEATLQHFRQHGVILEKAAKRVAVKKAARKAAKKATKKA